MGLFLSPTYVTAPPGDAHRLFVVEQGGTIQVLRDGVRRAEPFLTVPDVLNSDERGLLSMAFAPDYATSGRFYVYYVATGDSHIQIDEFRRSASNPDLASATTRRAIISIPHPNHTNHNGGQLQFGPDGFLYAGTGDGGGPGDPDLNAQNQDSLLGKMLRIDPLHPPAGASYAIPAGNPFVGQTRKRPEIWQYGLRNPFRFSFDRQTGDQWIGDVGQDKWEEVDFARRGAGAGVNWGWSHTGCEGNHPYVAGGASASSVCTAPDTKPVTEYDHSAGRCSITGGYVARDPALGALAGSYLFGDYCGGQIYARSGAGALTSLAPLNVPGIVSFGEDSCGHLYVVSQGDGSVSLLRTSSTSSCRDPEAPLSDPAVRLDRRDVHVSSSGYLRVRMRCSSRASQRCQGSVALRRGNLLVARASFTGAPGRLLAPRMRLTARGRALVRHRRRLAVQAAARSTDASGRTARTTPRVVLVA